MNPFQAHDPFYTLQKWSGLGWRKGILAWNGLMTLCVNLWFSYYVYLINCRDDDDNNDDSDNYEGEQLSWNGWPTEKLY